MALAQHGALPWRAVVCRRCRLRSCALGSCRTEQRPSLAEDHVPSSHYCHIFGARARKYMKWGKTTVVSSAGGGTALGARCAVALSLAIALEHVRAVNVQVGGEYTTELKVVDLQGRAVWGRGSGSWWGGEEGRARAVAREVVGRQGKRSDEGDDAASMAKWRGMLFHRELSVSRKAAPGGTEMAGCHAARAGAHLAGLVLIEHGE